MSLADVPVDDEEVVSRMIMTERHVRRTERETSAKPEAFLPFKHVELSVIRHREITERELWEIGHVVSKLREEQDREGRKFPLIGRGDITASEARSVKLDVVPAESPGMPRNHADIVGWPADKAAQLLRAAKLAAAAKFVGL